MTRWIILVALTLAACGTKDTASQGQIDAILALTGDATNGGTVFGNTCAGCHGADGSGASGPALGSQADDVYVDAMLNGTGDMGPQGLADQDMADVVAYIKATF